MKNLSKLILASSLFAMSTFAGTLAMTPTGIVDTPSSYTDTEGWSFSSSQNFQITALDYYDPGAKSLSASHRVGIWTSTGTLLVATTIPSGAPTKTDGLYESVAITPYSLGPGTYVIGATVGAGPDLTIFATTGESTIPGMTFLDGGLVSYSAGLSFPEPIGNNARPEFLTANLEVSPSICFGRSRTVFLGTSRFGNRSLGGLAASGLPAVKDSDGNERNGFPPCGRLGELKRVADGKET